jgi:signal transduction histidine kinase
LFFGFKSFFQLAGGSCWSERRLLPRPQNIGGGRPCVKADLDPDLLNISGSSVHLGKSLYNLASNASEAIAKDGGVTIKTTNQYLDKPIHGYDRIRAGGYVVLSVSDTGEASMRPI